MLKAKRKSGLHTHKMKKIMGSKLASLCLGEDNGERFENVNFLPMKNRQEKNLFLQTVCYLSGFKKEKRRGDFFNIFFHLKMLL